MRTAAIMLAAAALLGPAVLGQLPATATEPATDDPAACPVPGKHDPAVIKVVYRIGTERAVSAKVMLAMFETGWVESQMNNLPCGHLDSVGVFQQRPSMGWCDPASLCQNVEHATNKFLDAAERKEPDCGSGCTAGELAQRVQISKFKDRYDEAEGKARALLAEAKQLQDPATVALRVGTAGSTFGGKFQSFFRRADDHVLYHVYTPDKGWTNHDLGGSVVSAPTTVVHGGHLWVVARGTDNLLKYRIHSGDAWDTTWRSVRGGFAGAPAAALKGERLYFFVRSGTQVMYRYRDEDNGWNAEGSWRDLEKPAGVNVMSDPVTVFFDNRMFVVVRGSDNQFHVRGLGEKGWSGWTKLTGLFTGTPSAAVADDSTLFVFGRGADGAVRYHSLTKGATGWAQNRTLDANIGGSPSAISFGGLMSVYARNGAGELIYRTFDTNGWSPWRELAKPAGTALDSSPVTMKYGGVRIAAARAADHQLYIRNYSTTGGWSAWTKLPGTHASMP